MIVSMDEKKEMREECLREADVSCWGSKWDNGSCAGEDILVKESVGSLA